MKYSKTNIVVQGRFIKILRRGMKKIVLKEIKKTRNQGMFYDFLHFPIGILVSVSLCFGLVLVQWLPRRYSFL